MARYGISFERVDNPGVSAELGIDFEGNFRSESDAIEAGWTALYNDRPGEEDGFRPVVKFLDIVDERSFFVTLGNKLRGKPTNCALCGLILPDWHGIKAGVGELAHETTCATGVKGYQLGD